MAGNIYLKQGTHTSCNGTGIAGPSSGALAIANSIGNLTNSTNLDEFATALLSCAFGSAPTNGLPISLYLVPNIGTPGSVDTSTPFISQSYLVGNFYPVASAYTGLTLYIDGIPLMAYDYIPYILNGTNQNMSSNWTLDFYGTAHSYT